MTKKKLLFFILLLLVNSCSNGSFISQSSPPTQEVIIPTQKLATSVPSLTPILQSPTTVVHTPYLSTTRTATHSATSTHATTINQTPDRIEPRVVKLCPEVREVSLKDLGLNPKTRLVVLPQKSNGKADFNDGFFTISSVNTETEIIPNTTVLEDWQNNHPIFSPNGKWFAYFRYRLSQDEVYLQISSTDGTNQQKFGPYSGKDLSSFEWVSNQEIVTYKISYGVNQIPITSIFPFTGEVQMLSSLPEGSRSLAYLLETDGSHDVYYTPGLVNDSAFNIYDYSTGTSRPVLKWFSKEEWVRYFADSPWQYMELWSYNNNRIIILVKKSYGFDIATSLGIDILGESKSYGEVMQPIMIPEKGDELYTLWHAKSKPFFAFEIAYIFNEDNNHYYVFDFNQMILIDYCINIGLDVYASPDDQFLAWNVMDKNYPDRVKEIDILSLETGNIARLTGVELVGWGEVP